MPKAFTSDYVYFLMRRVDELERKLGREGFYASRTETGSSFTGEMYGKVKSTSKRKPTAYQKRYGTAYKKLKRKHPRMSFGSLSKKAHKEARR